MFKGETLLIGFLHSGMPDCKHLAIFWRVTFAQLFKTYNKTAKKPFNDHWTMAWRPRLATARHLIRWRSFVTSLSLGGSRPPASLPLAFHCTWLKPNEKIIGQYGKIHDYVSNCVKLFVFIVWCVLVCFQLVKNKVLCRGATRTVANCIQQESADW